MNKLSKQILLMLIAPVVIGLLVPLILLFFPKRVLISADINTHNIGFKMSKSVNGLTEKISPSIQSSILNIYKNEISLPVNTITNQNTNENLFIDGFITIKASKKMIPNCKRNGYVTMSSSNGDILNFRDLIIDIDSKVSMQSSNNYISISVMPNTRVSAVIEPSNPTILLLINYLSVFHNNQVIFENLFCNQLQCKLSYTPKSIFQISSAQGDEMKVRAHLSEIKDQVTEIKFAKFIKIKNITFIPEDTITKNQFPVYSADFRFYNLKREPINLKNTFICFHPDDELEVIDFRFRENSFEVSLAGYVRSIWIGKNRDFGVEILPSYLEWLYENQKIVIIVSIFIWMSGLVFSAIDYFNLKSNKNLGNK